MHGNILLAITLRLAIGMVGLVCLGACRHDKPGGRVEREIQYYEARTIFVRQATFGEIRRTFGEPSNVLTDRDWVYWSYVPINTSAGHVVGFEIWFKNGKSDSIHPIDVNKY